MNWPTEPTHRRTDQLALMRVLFLTHNYPRTAGDASGSFILRLAKALKGEEVEVRVVAPASAGVADHETVDGIPVDRFHYAPKKYETLAYGGNMAAPGQGSWGAGGKVLGVMGSGVGCA